MNLLKYNIKLNYIPHETVTSDDIDPARINKSYCRNKNNTFSLHQFEFLQSKLNFPIKKSKLYYYAGSPKKLPGLLTNPKSYWFISKTFISNARLKLRTKPNKC